MNLRILEFLLIWGCVKRVRTYPLGCTHNKTSYKEGDIVKIEDPCLNCICQKRALECSFQVCGEYTNVLPPGCFLLHKPNQCCPQLFCDKNFNSTGIELRTEHEVNSNLHENDCDVNGSIFAEGSAVTSSQPCEYCYCFRGEIKCIKPRCLHFFEDCTPAFEKTSCCPTHYDCRDANVNVLTSQINHFEATEKRNLEETTIEPEQKATVENHVTTIGFQTMKTGYISHGPTRIEFTEESTVAYETDERFTSASSNIKEESDVQIQSKLHKFNTTETSIESNEESRENASQVDDYDSYDYSEPRLPPSLPNLVIFPFVAADAMVKDKDGGTTNVAKRDETDKIDDTHHVFYNDYFFPPPNTEGGFIPKELTTSEKLIHESLCSNKKQADLSSKGLKKTAEASTQGNSFLLPPKEMNFPTLLGSSQTKKPVTVTYKNFIVDFYPNYLITTTKGIKSQHPPQQPAFEEVFDLQIKTIQDSPSDAMSEGSIHLSEEKNKVASKETNPETPRQSTTSLMRAPVSNIPLFEEFVNHFSLEEMTTKTTTALTNRKHEFSPKIKSQLFSTSSTVDPKQEKESQVVTEKLSFTQFSSSFSITETPQICSENQKSFKKEEIMEQIVKTTEAKKEKLELFQPMNGGNLSNEKKKLKVNGSEDEKNLVSLLGGTHLKLAGCNIYGVMYRVGKIIIELSGPCLECQCTSLGVQCRPLKC